MYSSYVYCYHLVNVITFSLSQSDHIKRLLLYIFDDEIERTCMNAHDKLYQDDERQQEVDGGEGDVIREVDLLALASFEPKNNNVGILSKITS